MKLNPFLLLLILGLPLLPTVVTRADDWPQWRGPNRMACGEKPVSWSPFLRVGWSFSGVPRWGQDSPARWLRKAASTSFTPN